MPRDLADALAAWIDAGFTQIGQVRIRRNGAGGFELRHVDDEGLDRLDRRTGSQEARHLATFDKAGEFRPLKTAPNLRRGWSLELADVRSVRMAVDYFYPAMLGVLRSYREATLRPVTLRETLDRQSGMYAVTRKVTDSQADEAIGGFCTSRGGCLKTILWSISPGVAITSLPPAKFDPAVNQAGSTNAALPMLCHEACNLLVGKIREVVKKQASAA